MHGPFLKIIFGLFETKHALYLNSLHRLYALQRILNVLYTNPMNAIVKTAQD